MQLEYGQLEEVEKAEHPKSKPISSPAQESIAQSWLKLRATPIVIMTLSIHLEKSDRFRKSEIRFAQ